jgi:hypothetical protein
MTLALSSGVAFAHEGANLSRSKPSEHDRQENYRSCVSSKHFGNCILGSMRCANSCEGFNF